MLKPSTLKSILFPLIIIIIFSFSNNEEPFTKDSYKQAIVKSLNNYLSLVNDKKWNESFDFVYPKLFEIVPKDSLVKKIVEMQNTGLNISVDSSIIDSVHIPLHHEKYRYTIIDYKAQLKIQISGEFEKMINNFKSQFESLYGKENVTYIESSKTFIIKTKQSIYAIASLEKDDWTYLESQYAQSNFSNKIIPQAVIKKFEK